MKNLYIESPFIGIGKTTLIKNIMTTFPTLDIELIPEPLNTKYLYKLYQELNSPKITNFCYMFENWIFCDRFLTYYTAPKKDIYIFDRSALAILAFSQTLVNNKSISLKAFNHLKKQIYMYMEETIKGNRCLYVNLTATYPTILQRINTRKRKGENLVSEKYLQEIQTQYEKYVDSFFIVKGIKKIEYNWETFQHPHQLQEVIAFLHQK
jgi:deoxyadenosine/deoxycytidine kinase